MVNTKKAFTISLVSAIVIAILYLVIQTILTSITFWIVGIIVFLFSFIGMKWKDWI